MRAEQYLVVPCQGLLRKAPSSQESLQEQRLHLIPGERVWHVVKKHAGKIIPDAREPVSFRDDEVVGMLDGLQHGSYRILKMLQDVAHHDDVEPSKIPW